MVKLNIFRKSNELSKWLLSHTANFPKSHRFSVAVKLENLILELIELITRAKKSHNKVGLLITADEKLLMLKIV